MLEQDSIKGVIGCKVVSKCSNSHRQTKLVGVNLVRFVITESFTLVVCCTASFQRRSMPTLTLGFELKFVLFAYIVRSIFFSPLWWQLRLF
jgi:hypothetical protein